MPSVTEQTATILVVEDGPSEREALVRALKIEQFQVLAAKDPHDAMQVMTQPVDLVISDLRMGPQSGIDLLRAWRERRPETPFIILTAYGDVDLAVKAMKLGATDFLTKPVDPPALLRLIRECLEGRRAAAELEPQERAGTRLEEIKKTAIVRALEQFHGNRTRAAAHLGVSVRTLQRKLKEWNMVDGGDSAAT